MQRLPIGLHPDALAESAAAVRWYLERSDTAADAFLAEIDRAIALVAEAPDRWPKHAHGTRRFFLRRFPFAVVYRVGTKEIEVVALAHGRRRPGYWKDR